MRVSTPEIFAPATIGDSIADGIVEFWAPYTVHQLLFHRIPPPVSFLFVLFPCLLSCFPFVDTLHSTPIKMLVTQLGKEEVILGLPWLKTENPSIDWKLGKIIL